MRDKQIIQAYNRGVRATQLAQEHHMSVRQVQRIIQRNSPYKAPRTGKSKDNQLKELRAIIIALMTEQGRDFTTCELCGGTIPPNRYDIHHTKYDNATYYDLRIVCRACNTAPLNRYLD